MNVLQTETETGAHLDQEHDVASTSTDMAKQYIELCPLKQVITSQEFDTDLGFWPSKLNERMREY